VQKLDSKTLGHGSWPREGIMRMALISDTHIQHMKLVMLKGDMLIHAGDFTNKGREKDITDFDDWLGGLDYRHKIVVFCNHDTETDALAIKKSGRSEPVKTC
jgi:predicted phosphodiesterase